MKVPSPCWYHQNATPPATRTASRALAMRLRSSVRCATSDIVASGSRGGRRRRRGCVTGCLPARGRSARPLGGRRRRGARGGGGGLRRGGLGGGGLGGAGLLGAGLLGAGAQLGGAGLGGPCLLRQPGGQLGVRGGRAAGGCHDLAADRRRGRGLL